MMLYKDKTHYWVRYASGDLWEVGYHIIGTSMANPTPHSIWGFIGSETFDDGDVPAVVGEEIKEPAE